MLTRYLAEPKSGRPSRPPPPDGLLRVAAEVLGVRYEWLVSDEGEMTPAAEAARLARGPGSSSEEQDDEFHRALEVFKTALPGLKSWGALWDLWLVVATSPALPTVVSDGIKRGDLPLEFATAVIDDLTNDTREVWVMLAEWIADHVRSTLNALVLEPAQLQDDGHREAYVVLLCQALRAAWLGATTEMSPRTQAASVASEEETPLTTEPAPAREKPATKKRARRRNKQHPTSPPSVGELLREAATQLESTQGRGGDDGN